MGTMLESVGHMATELKNPNLRTLVDAESKDVRLRGQLYIDMLNGYSRNFNSRWTNAERGRQHLVCGYYVAKSGSLGITGNMREWQKLHVLSIPDIAHHGPASEYTVGASGRYDMPAVITVSTSTFHKNKHPKKRQKTDIGASMEEWTDNDIPKMHQQLILRLPNNEFTYKTGWSALNFITFLPNWDPMCTYAYFNYYGYTKLVVGTLRPNTLRMWVFKVESSITGFPKPQLVATKLGGTSGKMVLRVGDGVKGHVKRNVSMEAFARLDERIRKDRGTVQVNNRFYADMIAAAKIAASVGYSEAWSGCPYVDGLTTSSRLNSFPFQVYSHRDLWDAWNRTKPYIEAQCDVDELLNLLEGHSMTSDGEERILIKSKLNEKSYYHDIEEAVEAEDEDIDEPVDPISAIVKVIPPELAIGRAIIDACNMRAVVPISSDGSVLGPPISKKIADCLFRPTMKGVYRRGKREVLETRLYSLSHMHAIVFGGAYGLGDMKVPLYLSDYIEGIKGGLYDLPVMLGSVEATCYIYVYDGIDELTDLMLILGERLGGVTVGDDAVFFDTPLIKEGLRVCLRLQQSVVFRSFSRLYVWARSKEQPGDVTLFSNRSSPSATTGNTKEYKFRGSKVMSPFRTAPPDESFEYRELMNMYKIQEFPGRTERV